MSNSVVVSNSANRILARLLSGDRNSSPNVLYLEFQAGTSSPINPPVANPADDDYYLNLRANQAGNQDFLRIPVASVTPKINPDNPNDITLFFNGICVGNTGVGGKSTAGAIIYGIALVSSPTHGTAIDDITRDIVWARGYFVRENQMPFSQVAQTAITFRLNLTN